MAEIGRNWPKPCRGVLKFLEVIRKMNDNGIDVQLSILSSGHEMFILKTFKIWGYSLPEIIVTDDDMRGRREGYLKKPDGQLFNAIHLRWLAATRVNADQSQLLETRQRMIYFGDDPKKDGGLAKAAGIAFGWFNPSGRKRGILGKFFSFNDWRQISQLFSESKTIAAFKEGRPFEEIISPLL
jgi:FMN phosphatase YigB (HAD superfamily)